MEHTTSSATRHTLPTSNQMFSHIDSVYRPTIWVREMRIVVHDVCSYPRRLLQLKWTASISRKMSTQSCSYCVCWKHSAENEFKMISKLFLWNRWHNILLLEPNRTYRSSILERIRMFDRRHLLNQSYSDASMEFVHLLPVRHQQPLHTQW